MPNRSYLSLFKSYKGFSRLQIPWANFLIFPWYLYLFTQRRGYWFTWHNRDKVKKDILIWVHNFPLLYIYLFTQRREGIGSHIIVRKKGSSSGCKNIVVPVPRHSFPPLPTSIHHRRTPNCRDSKTMSSENGFEAHHQVQHPGARLSFAIKFDLFFSSLFLFYFYNFSC